jgi:adenylosuccinate synthase
MSLKYKKRKFYLKVLKGFCLMWIMALIHYVTSSNTVASSAATGTGCGPNYN